jgi:hypothetical protein
MLEELLMNIDIKILEKAIKYYKDNCNNCVDDNITVSNIITILENHKKDMKNQLIFQQQEERRKIFSKLNSKLYNFKFKDFINLLPKELWKKLSGQKVYNIFYCTQSETLLDFENILVNIDNIKTNSGRKGSKADIITIDYLIQGYNELVNNQDMYNEMLTKL